MSAQSAHDLDRATREYKAFLSDTLYRLADRRARAGDFSRAIDFFEQAAPLAPKNVLLLLDYAEARSALDDFVGAQSSAEEALAVDPENTRGIFVLAKILLHRDQNQRAKELLEKVVQRDPTFEHGYALGAAYLKLKDPQHAANIFKEMQAGFGDTPAIHMEFGRAFAESGYPEQAIDEFKKTIGADSKFPGAHYSLGAAYLVGLADAAFPQAASEFEKELTNHPDDVLSLYQLGYIALSQHKLDEAEKYLRRASILDPTNPDMPLSLGQTYAEQSRQVDAETELRRSIELSKDVSRNHYQVQRAHYLLGRLLIQTGRPEEAKQEFKVADQLLKQSVAANQGQPGSGMLNDVRPDVAMRRLDNSPPLSPESLQQLVAYETQVGPAIADAFNNLGAMSAGDNQFTAAVQYFRQAAVWNPSLEGLDYNWGRAAFSAMLYADAIAPLTRYLASHPNDTTIRSALGSSLFNVKKYAEAVEVLRPLAGQISSNNRLDYIYSVSLVKSGAVGEGMSRLSALEKALPQLSDVHAALGDGYQRQGDDAQAIREFRVAVELNPSDFNTKRQLAMSLIKVGKKPEGQNILADLIHRHSNDPDVYLELARLQLAHGDNKDAMATLEEGVRVMPGNEAIHRDLAKIYLLASRTLDAERETRLSEDIRRNQAKLSDHSNSN